MLYATTEDYQGTPPANLDRLLASASRLVARATRTAIYRTTADGLPLETPLRDAMRDATLAQVDAWVAAGVDPVTPITGSGRAVAAKSIGGASITYADAQQHAAAQAALGVQLTDEAYSILQLAGLTGGGPVVYG